MKDYFIRLFDYDKHTNLLTAQLVIDSGNPEKAVRVMAHSLAAQQIWLARCKAEPAIGGALWPDWGSDIFESLIKDNHTHWIDFLDTLTPGDFEKEIDYKNSRGDSFSNKLTDVLAHVINHGTHHRAQIGVYLRQAGIENLPYMDYIFYIRELEQTQK